MATVTVSFSLDSEEDKRILRWLEGIERQERWGKSRAIRNALYAYLDRNGITLRDIYDAIQDLKRGGFVLAQRPQTDDQSDLPADVLENLDNLGL